MLNIFKQGLVQSHHGMSSAASPAWHFLDPETQFVSARHVDSAGWTGKAEDIVAFHMLWLG